MLRRALIADLVGFRIIGIRIAGINNEFSIIPGIREDVLEIILNLKEIIFKSDLTETTYVRLRIQGPCIVTADYLKLPPGIEILNPHNHILTISDNSVFEIEIKLKSGKGYNLAEESKTDEFLDYIPIDSNFMPVSKINFFTEEIEPLLESKKEKLFLDIWTNGSITPEESIKRATIVLMSWLINIQNIKPYQQIQIIKNSSQNIKKDKNNNIPIEILQLSPRLCNILKKSKINYIQELKKWTRDDLLEIKNLGPKSVDEIQTKLTNYFELII
ncbi:unnamed protein product [Ectocarpus sp. 12 AP-2014]